MKGIATTAVRFELPFCLYVDDGLYELVIDGRPGAIQIRRKPRCSRVDNLPFDRTGFIINIDPLNCEMTGDRFGRVAYSDIIVYIPTGGSPSEELSIKLFVLPPRLHKLNGSVERGHRTCTEEFYEERIKGEINETGW